MRKLWSAAVPLVLFPFALASADDMPKKQSHQSKIKTQDVSYEHAGQPLKGYLAWDDSVSQDQKRPGVLIVHEWWGLNDYARGRAEDLARLGYVAFALDMYGEGKVTEHPTQALEWASSIRADSHKWRDRAAAGLEQLKKQKGVDPDNLAAIGYCFGGSTVLQLAFEGAPVKGVVSFHGGLTPPDLDVAVKPRVLVLTGAADSMIPPAQVDAFVFGMERAKADYAVITLGGARHGFTNPDAGHYGIENIAYNATADHRSWDYMQVFFDEIFNEQNEGDQKANDKAKKKEQQGQK